MKKLYFNLLCLLFVIFIIYCFTRTEGFFTIDTSQICVTDTAGAITCDGSTVRDQGEVGQQGHVCISGDTTGYTLVDSDPNFNLHSGVSFNMGSNFDCDPSTHERFDANIPPLATPCIAHNGEISLSGCIEKCPQTTQTGFNTVSSASLLPSVPEGKTPLQGVTCSSASLLPATNACYERDHTGALNINRTITSPGACESVHGNIWYVGGQDADLEAVCHNRSDGVDNVQPYQIIGCEEGCLQRRQSQNKQDYITTPNEDQQDVTEHGDNREVIYIGDDQISGTNDPYIVTENNLASDGSFDVQTQCNQSVTTSTGTVSFDHPFAADDLVAQRCDLNVDTSDINLHKESRRYSVDGCYPSCADSDRCSDMLFSYPVGTPAPDLVTFKANLWAAYQAGESPIADDKENEFKEKIYYYRKFRHGGQDHIEAQFKCAADDCEFVDASLEAAVQSLGADASRTRIVAIERGIDVTAIDAAVASLGNFATLYDFNAAVGLSRVGSELADGQIDISQRIKKWVIGRSGTCETECRYNFGPLSKCVDDEQWRVTTMDTMRDKLAEGNRDTRTKYKMNPANPDFECYTEGELRAMYQDDDGNFIGVNEMTGSWNIPGAARGTGANGVNPLADGETSPPVIITINDNTMPNIDQTGKAICWHQSRTAGDAAQPDICNKTLDNYNTQAKKLCQCYVPRADICRRSIGSWDALSSSDDGESGVPASCAPPDTWEPWQEPP